MASPKQVKSRIVAFVSILLSLAIVSPASEPPPSARELLALVRANQASQERDLNGKLRMSTSEEKIAIPFRLFLRGNAITYQFTDKPEALILHLGEKTSRLERVTGSGKTEKITGAKLDDPVRGTDISYEDLALKFLYWNNAAVEKEKQILMTRSCWIVRAFPSGKGESQYDMARLWIESTGGLLQAECYSGGKLVRRFSVRNVQSAHGTGGYILKSMSIQRMDEKDKDHYPTYLEVQQQ
ncbi:MAG: outer membrane lipoprotein-sorting protein [Verrucomicrobia bacterium]|nr:outer membrane lipoprotein-sorting protein [Verrucomicrobiota bacterium]